MKLVPTSEEKRYYIVEFTVEVDAEDVDAFEHDPFGGMQAARDLVLSHFIAEGMHQHPAVVTRMRGDEEVDSYLLWQDKFALPDETVVASDWKSEDEIK